MMIVKKYWMNVAGACSIVSASLAIPMFIIYVVFDKHNGGLEHLETALDLIGLGLLIYMLLSFKRLLNEQFHFYDVDKLIDLLIYGSAGVRSLYFLFLYGNAMDNMIIVLLPLGGVFLGIVRIIFALKLLLRLHDDLFGLLKPLCYALIVCGSCLTSTVLISVGLLASLATDVVLGLIFFRAAKGMSVQPSI